MTVVQGDWHDSKSCPPTRFHSVWLKLGGTKSGTSQGVCAQSTLVLSVFVFLSSGDSVERDKTQSSIAFLTRKHQTILKNISATIGAHIILRQDHRLTTYSPQPLSCSYPSFTRLIYLTRIHSRSTSSAARRSCTLPVPLS